MFVILHALGGFVTDLFKSRCRLEAENLLLLHQLTIALRASARLRLLGSDRALLIWMTRLWPSLLDAVRVVQPETVLRWQASFASARPSFQRARMRIAFLAGALSPRTAACR
jgi:hypothetical protein